MANCTNLLVPPSFDSAPVTKPLKQEGPQKEHIAKSCIYGLVLMQRNCSFFLSSTSHFSTSLGFFLSHPLLASVLGPFYVHNNAERLHCPKPNKNSVVLLNSASVAQTSNIITQFLHNNSTSSTRWSCLRLSGTGCLRLEGLSKAVVLKIRCKLGVFVRGW